MFGGDNGTKINDRLARYLVECLNADLNPADPNPDEGWFLDSPEDGNKQARAILVVTLILRSGSGSSTQKALKRIRRWAESLWL
ncbi:hypothetical protein ACFQY9_31605 [Microvirga aerilata]|uniref:hypothetical protein n=1 Tax=Microvirga aerilata TaxID=670292 RepID=UPI00362F0B46